MLVIFHQAIFVWRKDRERGTSNKKARRFLRKRLGKSMLSWFFVFKQKGRGREHRGPDFRSKT